MKHALFTLILAALAPIAHAAPPGILNHQGRIAVGGVNFDGTGHFKFALVDGAGTTSFWSNDGTSVGGGEPTASVAVTVSKGHYGAALGETAAIPVSVFADNDDVRLRVWFSRTGGVGTFEQLTPDRRVASAGYALSAEKAQSVADGAITGAMLAAGSVTGDTIADGAVGVADLATETVYQSGVVLYNPSLDPYDVFGRRVAAVGADKLLIGAYRDDTGADDAGSAYLFDLTGTLLATINNPTPDSFDSFGWSVAAVGADKLLVGAHRDDTGANDAGSAYLFDLSGNLLATINNPTPDENDRFGWSVAGVGADKLLIGAIGDNTGANDAGSAYLFDLSGTLLATINHPDPDPGHQLGQAVAGVGSDKLLIGAQLDGTNDAGLAYLFDLSGTLLATINNPTPGSFDSFGFSVAAVGSDKLLIGAYRDDTGANDAGSAYLFDTSGTLLATINNPAPDEVDRFGWSVAGVGTDKLLVGAPYDDTAAENAGSAYLFDLSGNLLATISNPSAESFDFFASSVAGVGTDKLLVGSNYSLDSPVFLYSPMPAIVGLTSGGVVDGSIGSASIADGAIDTADLRDGSITAAKLAPGFEFADADADPGNELQTLSRSGTTVTLSDGGGSVSIADDDSDPTNELQTLDLSGGNLSLSGGGGDVSVGTIAAEIPDGALESSMLEAIEGEWVATKSLFNPAPGDSVLFGFKMAAVGNDRVLFGVPSHDTNLEDEGIAYLFDLDGNLLQTFRNPTPGADDEFGESVAAVGADKVIIGAVRDDTAGSNAGAAYLFRVDGTLLATILSPAPMAGDLFGSSVAAAGVDRIVIGATGVDTAVNGVGAAYLFDLLGNHLQTLANPDPVAGDSFGLSVIGVGADKVLVGASAKDHSGLSNPGAAYLFNLQGGLLDTITAPTPTENAFFGQSLAAVGPARLLIGEAGNLLGTSLEGKAYLMTLQGSPIFELSSPDPQIGDRFGFAVATAGGDHLLVGAITAHEADVVGAGAAYLFDDQGDLVTTLRNPTPVANEFHGAALAGFPSGEVLVGTPEDRTVGERAGAAYLYEPESFTPELVASGLRAGAVVSESIVDRTVSTADLATGAVDSRAILDNSITAADIAFGTVGSSEIENDSIQNVDIKDGTITNADLSASISFDDADADPSNELQSLSLAGDTLSLSNSGGSADLSQYLRSDTSDTFTGNDLNLASGSTLNLGVNDTSDKTITFDGTQSLSWDNSQTRLEWSDELALTGPLLVGSTSDGTVPYNRFGPSLTGHSLDNERDLLISDDLEVNGDLFADGDLLVDDDLAVGDPSSDGRLRVADSAFPVGLIERTSGLTGSIRGALGVRHTTTADMVDGFGASIAFSIKDSGGAAPNIGQVGAVRGGADTTGDLFFTTYTSGTGTEKMRVLSSGEVGIGTDRPTHLLHVNGVARSAQSTWATSSDARVKENIQPLDGSLEKIKELRPVTFEYTEDYQQGRGEAYGGEFTGFVAQEVKEVFPEMVSTAPEEVGEGSIDDFNLLNTSSLVPHLVAAVQELEKENDNKDREIANLMSDNAAILERLSAIEALLKSHPDLQP